MKDKKQIIAFSLLIFLSVAFILSCLFLPLFYMKICDFSNGDIILEGNFSFIQFLKLGCDGILEYAIYESTGPVWLSLAMIFLNLLTMIGCVFLLILSIIGLIFAFIGKSFSFKNSAIYKIGGFVGGFSIVSFTGQLIGFIVLTAMANNLLFFYALYGCFINPIIGIAILVVSHFVKNKEGLLKQNKTRDAVFFGLTAVLSFVFAFLLITCIQFNGFIIEPENATVLGLNQISTYFMLHPNNGDIPFGVCFYAMIMVVIGLVFVTIYSIIGFIRVLCGRDANWLSIRVKRWSRAVLDVFSIFFALLMCIMIILGINMFWFLPEGTFICLSNFAFVEFVLPFILVILTRFIGVYKGEDKFKQSNVTSSSKTDANEIKKDSLSEQLDKK